MKKMNRYWCYPVMVLEFILILATSCKKEETGPIEIPALTTTTISKITSTTAICGGKILFDGGGAIKTKGVCWSTSANPTISDFKTLDDNGIEKFTSLISGLSLDQTYYVRAYATNSLGTGYGNEVSFNTILAVGDTCQGGIVAYILQPDDPGYIANETHGLIAASTNQSESIEWYNKEWIETNVTSTELGTGNTNTNSIVRIQGDGFYAAKLCYDLVLGGYSDWYLPSKDELEKLFDNRIAIGNFGENVFWSSSECYYSSAYVKPFLNYNSAHVEYDLKNTYLYVRAVRSFVTI